MWAASSTVKGVGWKGDLRVTLPGTTPVLFLKAIKKEFKKKGKKTKPVDDVEMVLEVSLLEHRAEQRRIKSKSGLGLASWFSGEEFTCQCRGHRFSPWSRKIPNAMGQLKPLSCKC